MSAPDTNRRDARVQLVRREFDYAGRLKAEVDITTMRDLLVASRELQREIDRLKDGVVWAAMAFATTTDEHPITMVDGEQAVAWDNLCGALARATGEYPEAKEYFLRPARADEGGAN